MSQTVTQTVMAELSEQQAVSLKMLLDRGVKIPLQPKVAEQFKLMVARGEKDVRRLARILLDDPGISGPLFKITKTPAFKPFLPFESLEDILQAVGLKQTVNLVNALGFASAFPKNRSGAYEAYWARSRAVAQLAMLVSEFRFGEVDTAADQAYLAGILHDCGVPVLMQRFPSYCDSMSLATSAKWVDLAEEDRKYFADHAVVGYLVGRHWGLPDEVCAAIRFHHDLAATTPVEARPLTAMIQYALELYHRDRRMENRDWEGQREGVYEALHFTSADHEQQVADAIFVAYDAIA